MIPGYYRRNLVNNLAGLPEQGKGRLTAIALFLAFLANPQSLANNPLWRKLGRAQRAGLLLAGAVNLARLRAGLYR